MNDGVAMAQMIVTPKDINPLGLVYGGISYNFADIVAGCTFYSAGGYGPTVSANYDYLRSTADTESLVAIAKDIKRGKHIHFIEVEIYNDRGSVKIKAYYDDEVQRGTLVTLGVWWQSQSSDPHVAINALTAARPTDQGWGITFYDVQVHIRNLL